MTELFFSSQRQSAPDADPDQQKPSPTPFLFRNKQPDGPHQMFGGDVDISFPENLPDPMNADAAPVGFQDLVLAFS